MSLVDSVGGAFGVVGGAFGVVDAFWDRPRRGLTVG